MSQRLIAISDIHGYYNEFIKLMKEIDYKKGVDKLYILGDMVDRGPESFKTLILVRNLQLQYPETVHVIRGNHDDEFLKIIKMLYNNETLDTDGWDLYAGFTGDELRTIEVYSTLLGDIDKGKLIDWLESLPLYVEDGEYIFTHAAIDPKLTLELQQSQYLLWGRYNEEKPTFVHNPVYNGRVVVFGHVCTRTIFKITGREITDDIWYDTKYYDKIGIDCGIWTGGKLGALIIKPAENKYEEVYIEHPGRTASK